MDLKILDKNFNTYEIIDVYESLIWTDRYYSCGDFEIYAPSTEKMLNSFKQDYYVVNPNSERVMIIESLKYKEKTEEGPHLTVTGRSLESILERRIVWGQKILSGNLQTCIHTLLNDNVINPVIPARKIDNFIFKESTDPKVTSLNIKAQYTGTNLYTLIRDMCCEYNIGFMITLDNDYNFVFELYSGKNRSKLQEEISHVVFSPKMNNLSESQYIKSDSCLKNATLIGGEGEGAERKYAAIKTDESVGIERRELFTDARDISSKSTDGAELSDSEYKAQLEQRGKEKIYENVSIAVFDGKIDENVMYKYGDDYYLGDTVTISDSANHEKSVEILEVVYSENAEGVSLYPTFKTASNVYTASSDSGNAPIPQPGPGESILDKTWAVGSVYISVGKVSPAQLYGGNWTEITNRFLWCQDHVNDTKRTGGAYSFTCTTSHMPYHKHAHYPHHHGAGSYAKGNHSHTQPFKGFGGVSSNTSGWYFGRRNVSGDSNNGWWASTNTTGNHAHGIYVNDTTSSEHGAGSGAAHSIMPPWLSVNAWYRVS